ncbi:hypothetical protein CERZMDRAFT_89505 [Cercospora zeae-maydis SCOH1-5]|uniref:Uncharacterized protein n=1 Tax=Cercospora zeae-maydis SCOH1-5 TaxID=717836 RepID=A0A6A6F1D9_9PEZI|nr:hypothetical protein CERZMDRAFT_89505 [Cercospora zeae-maydis SCOH1-5]
MPTNKIMKLRMRNTTAPSCPESTSRSSPSTVRVRRRDPEAGLRHGHGPARVPDRDRGRECVGDGEEVRVRGRDYDRQRDRVHARDHARGLAVGPEQDDAYDRVRALDGAIWQTGYRSAPRDKPLLYEERLTAVIHSILPGISFGYKRHYKGSIVLER